MLEGSMLTLGIKPGRGVVAIPGNKLIGYKLDTLIISDS